MQLSNEEYALKKKSIVVWCKLKILSLGTTVRCHLARPVMTKSYFCDRIFNLMSHVMRKPVHAICEQQRHRSACACAFVVLRSEREPCPCTLLDTDLIKRTGKTYNIRNIGRPTNNSLSLYNVSAGTGPCSQQSLSTNQYLLNACANSRIVRWISFCWTCIALHNVTWCNVKVCLLFCVV